MLTLRIGSRGSTLALWQAEYVKARLLQVEPSAQIEIVVIQTTGDRITDVPLARIGDRGLFTKELDRAIQDGVVDLAVHSLKDLPTLIASGLEIAAVLERADPNDVLVVAPGRPRRLRDLPSGSRIGTSSLRRRAQLAALRPDLVVEDLRGNLDTRLRRVADGDFDGALLARAGLERLGLQDHIAEVLESPQWLPAVGQGALGITTRAQDDPTRDLVLALEHAETRTAVVAERALLSRLEGGCQIPIGAHARVSGAIELDALVASIDGRKVVRGSIGGEHANAYELGVALAEQLLDQGAREILAELRAHQLPTPAAP